VLGSFACAESRDAQLFGKVNNFCFRAAGKKKFAGSFSSAARDFWDDATTTVGGASLLVGRRKSHRRMVQRRLRLRARTAVADRVLHDRPSLLRHGLLWL
jgi:hypothetical protein